MSINLNNNSIEIIVFTDIVSVFSKLNYSVESLREKTLFNVKELYAMYFGKMFFYCPLSHPDIIKIRGNILF